MWHQRIELIDQFVGKKKKPKGLLFKIVLNANTENTRH